MELFSFSARAKTVLQDEKKIKKKREVFDLEELMGFWLENTVFEM